MVAAIEENMPQRDRGGVPLPAGGRGERTDRRRRQLVPDRGRRGRPHPADRPRPRAQADRAFGRSRRGATRLPSSSGSRHCRRRPPARPQPDALHRRRRARRRWPLGEICDAWRAVWGTWREQPVPGRADRVSRWRPAPRGGDLDLHAVVGELDAVRHRQLRRAVGQSRVRAPEAAKASSASSALRCPRGSPSAAPVSRVASQTSRSASRRAR